MQSSLSTLLPRLWSRVSTRHRLMFWLVFALAATTAVAEVVTLGALYPFIMVLVAPQDAATPGFLARFLAWLPAESRPEQLWLLTLLFIVAVLVATALRCLLLLAQTTFVNRLGSAFSIDIYRRTLHQPYRVHVARNSSEVVSVIAGKVNGVISSVLMPCIVIASSLIMLLAVMASLLAVQPVVALSMLGGFAGIYGIVAWATKARLSREGRIMAEQQVITLRALQEGLGGIRDILIDGTQELFCRVYKDADHRGRQASAAITFIANLPRSLIEGLGMVLIAVIAYGLAASSNSPGGALPVLAVVALGAQRLLPLVQNIYSNWGVMHGHARALAEVLALLEQPIVEEELRTAGRETLLPFNTAIELRNLGFVYQTDGQEVLQDINLVIRKGDRLGVIGATGSGKSTLIDLLLGLLEPTSGQLLVDGVPLEAGRLRAWQNRVAHVPQSIFLADATIAENIAFGQPGNRIDAARVQEAARRAQISDTIEQMPQGYDTRIGERGVRLSGGQRQRIGIARALYKRADVLVLDEATSALDNQTESMVMEAVEQLDADLTIIMIAHRLSTLRSCSNIIELKKGIVHQRGTYQNLHPEVR